MPRPTAYVARDGKKTWRVRVRVDGKQTSETFPSKVRAEGFCRDVDDIGAAAAIRRLEATATRRGAPTVDKVFDQFAAWKDARVRSDRTVHDYRAMYDNWIRPTFGKRPLQDVTATDVQAWVDAMVEKRNPRTGRRNSAKSIVDRHALLHAIFGFAAAPARQLVDSNVAAGTDLPKRHKGQPKGLRPAEWQALEPALRQIDPDGADLAVALLATGWRWSEVVALVGYAVEDDGENMWVTMERVARRNAAGKRVIVPDGKSDAAMRRIKLDEDAARMVRRRMWGRRPGDLVFTTSTGAQWHESNFRDRIWDPAVRASGLSRRPTPHWLRHTHVFWMTLQGASLPELQARLGHESITTTIGVYGRMISDVQPAVLAGFAALRAPSGGPAAVSGQVTPPGLPGR